MPVSPEVIEQLITSFREFVPRDFAPNSFEASDVFFKEFDTFKYPLIGYLADKTEAGVQNVSDHITEDFLRGHIDGVVSVLRLIADINLVKNHNPGS